MIKERINQYNEVNNWINKNYHIAEKLKLSELVEELKEYNLIMDDRVDFISGKSANKSINVYHNYESILRSSKDEDIIEINLDLDNLTRVEFPNLKSQIIIRNYLEGNIDLKNNLEVIIATHTYLPNKLNSILGTGFIRFLGKSVNDVFKTLLVRMKIDTNIVLLSDDDLYCREFTDDIKDLCDGIGYKYKTSNLGIFLYQNSFIAYNSKYDILKQNYSAKAYTDLFNLVIRDIKFNKALSE